MNLFCLPSRAPIWLSLPLPLPLPISSGCHLSQPMVVWCIILARALVYLWECFSPYFPSVSCTLLLLASSLPVMRPDLEACGRNFTSCYRTTCSDLVYHGPVQGILSSSDSPPLMTNAGCKALCGTGNQYYPWKESSATITTWILPVLGLILQLPFESNACWRTLWALARWGGR